MQPTTTFDTVRLEQARRLEGFRRWSRRTTGPAGASDPGSEPTDAHATVTGAPSRRGGGRRGLRHVVGC